MLFLALFVCVFVYDIHAAEHYLGFPPRGRSMLENDRHRRVQVTQQRIDNLREQMINDRRNWGQEELLNCYCCSVTPDGIGLVSTATAGALPLLVGLLYDVPLTYSAPVAVGATTLVNSCFQPDQQVQKAQLERLRIQLHRFKTD